MIRERLLAQTERWRDEADRYERDGVPGHAKLLRRVASDLEEFFCGWWTEELTLTEAAAERGCAYDTLQRKLANGEVRNVGRKNRPRVRRCDLWSGTDDGEHRTHLTAFTGKVLLP